VQSTVLLVVDLQGKDYAEACKSIALGPRTSFLRAKHGPFGPRESVQEQSSWTFWTKNFVFVREAQSLTYPLVCNPKGKDKVKTTRKRARAKLLDLLDQKLCF